MPIIVDSYSESNVDGFAGADEDFVGQSFTATDGILYSVRFYLKKNGTPTGSIFAYIYAHTGTFGTSSVPTGSALATSDAIDISTLSGTGALQEFIFSGVNKISLSNGTKYVAVVDTVDNTAGRDQSSPSHAGNSSGFAGSWSAYDFEDLAFYVYKDSSTFPNYQGPYGYF